MGLLVKIVEHDFGHCAALEFDHQTHTGFVGFVLNVTDVFDFLFVHQLGHALLQSLFVDLVRQFIHDDGLALAPVNVFKMAFGTHDHAASTRAVAFFDTADAINDAGGGKVRRGHDLHQIVDGGIRMAQHVQAGVHDFIQVVRRDVGGHAHRNARRPIHQQIGKFGGHYQRLFFAAVVVRPEIDGFFVQIVEHFVGDFG